MANQTWEYAWEFFYGSYFSAGGARLTQSPTAPTQEPFVDGVVTDPPPRNPPTISPAFGKLDSSQYFAYSPGATYVIRGKDRIINWRYRYIYHGESGFGTCGGGGDYSYGQPATTPLLLAVPDVMAAPSGDLAGWQAIALRVAASYMGNGGVWGDKNAYGCDTDDSFIPGSAQMDLERVAGGVVLDRSGQPVRNVQPATSFDAALGVVRPPAVWPPMQVRVVHALNTIIVTITIVAYVRVESSADPPEPPPPGNNVPQPDTTTGVPSGPPSDVTTGVAGNAVLRPPC